MSETDFLVVAIVSLVGSFIKSVTGMGYPLIAVPILTLFVGVETAIAVIAIPNLVANLVLNLGVRDERRHARDLGVLVITSIVGAVAGTLLLVRAPEEPLLLGLALTVLIFVVQRWRHPDLRLDAATSRRWAPIVGLMAGFSHGAVGVSGPIVALWIHGYRLPKNAYVFSVTALFLVGGAAQLVVLMLSGQLGRDRLLASAIGLVATLAMIPVGIRMRRWIAGATFERLILALLIVSGLSLIWRALG